MFPALLCGTAVILTPAEDVPLTAHLLVEVLLEAGLPPDVVQLVHGEGSVVGRAMVEHPDISVISFTGSTETGSIIGATCGRMHKRLSLEMGGKNAMIVLDDANLDLAVEGVLWGAFGTTGQRCTATSRVILQKSIFNKFRDALVSHAQSLRIGNGLETSTQMGPQINQAQIETSQKYVDIGKNEGAKLAAGGSRLDKDSYAHGYFFQPTVFSDVDPKMRIAQEEIFGPVVSLIPTDGLDQAIDISNGVIYGLSTSIYTRNVNAAFRAARDLY